MKQVLKHEAEAAKQMALQPHLMLFDQMGVGKTVTTLTGLKKASEGSTQAFKVIICVPNTLVDQWRQEVSLWSDDTFQCVVGTGDAAQRSVKYEFFKSYQGNLILITTYSLIVRDSFFNGVDAQAVVLDEVFLLRNRRSKSYNFFYTWFLTKQFERVYFLSGNVDAFSGEQFFNLVELLFPGEFKKAPKDQLIEQLGERYISRGFECLDQVFNYPQVDFVTLQFTEKQKELIGWVRSQCSKQQLKAVQLTERLFNVDYSQGEKEKFLEKLIEKTPGKIVIYCEHVGFFRLLQSDLNLWGYKYEVASGKMPLDKRDRAINIFKNDPKVKCLLLSGIGKLGLNLQAAQTLVCMTVPKSRVELQQLVGRLNRINQTGFVHCFIPYFQDSVEEKQVAKLR